MAVKINEIVTTTSINTDDKVVVTQNGTETRRANAKDLVDKFTEGIKANVADLTKTVQDNKTEILNTLDSLNSQMNENTNQINKNTNQINENKFFISSDLGTSQPTSSLFAISEKKAFDIRGVSEFDAQSNMQGVLGVLSVVSTSTVGKAIRALEGDAINSFCLQAQMYYDGANGSEFIGFCSSAKGVLPTNEYVFKLGFTPSGTAGFSYYNGSTTNILPNASLTTGWYTVTLTKINTSLIISIQKEGTTKVTTKIITGETHAVNNLYFECYYASDKIRNIRYIANNNINLLTPYFANSKNFHTGYEMNTTGNVQSIAHLPASYNPNIKNKCVIMFHGSNGKATDFWSYDNENSILQGLLDAGYVVIASTYTDRKCWGNPQAMTDISNLITHYNNYLNIQDNYYIVMESMGGTVALNSIVHLPALQGRTKAIIGIYPAINLESLYTNDTGLKADIATAYGISSDSEFQTKTDGYDAMNDNDGTIFKYIPMKFWASSGDTVVPKVNNSDAFATKINALGGSVEVIATTGNHGDASNFVPSDVVAFLNQY